MLSRSAMYFAPPWTVAHQVPLPMEFSRQEYWSWVPFPTPGSLSDPGIEAASLKSPAGAAGSLTLVPLEKPNSAHNHNFSVCLSK